MRKDAWLAAVAIATALPLFATEFLPFTDLPEHVAVMATLRHYFDPAWQVQSEYVFTPETSQYLLYHVAGALLSAVVGSAELANRLLLALVAISFPYGLRALLRAFGRDERLAVFACAIFWSRPLLVGFLPFVAAVPLVLFALARLVRHLATPSRRGAVVLALLALALFYTHANAFLLFAATSGALALALAPIAQAMRRLLFMAPALAAALVWSIVGNVTLRGDSLADEGEVYRMAFGRAARAAPMWTHDVWTSHVDEACAIVYWLAFVVLVVLDVRARLAAKERTRLLDPTLVPFACAAVLYFLMPFRVGAGVMLNVRMAMFLPLFAVLSLGRLPEAAGAPIRAVLAASLLLAGDCAYEMRWTAREELGDFDRLLALIHPRAHLVSLEFDIASGRSHFPPWMHVGAYHRARHGGVAEFSFTQLHHWPLHYLPRAAPPPKAETFWDFNPCLFRNSSDGPYYEYVLVRGNVDPFRGNPEGPAWHRVGRELDWSLYQRDDGAAPFAGPDVGPCEEAK